MEVAVELALGSYFFYLRFSILISSLPHFLKILELSQLTDRMCRTPVPHSLPIQPITAFRATVRPPGSKSLTNRALLLAALAEGSSTLTGVLFADDSRRMLEALKRLGFDLHIDEAAAAVRITGRRGSVPVAGADLNLGNAGTAYRFLTAALCLGDGVYILDGIERMRQRPVAQLVAALRQLGATIEHTMCDGCPPLRITGTGHLRGGELTMPPTLSSQYISALLQIGSYCDEPFTLRFDGPVTSRPYVEMTLRLMQTFGVTAQVDRAFTAITLKPAKYCATDYAIEPDASNASYFLAAAAVVAGSSCTIENLGKRSLQGDVGFADVLHQMGAGLIFGGDFITVMAPPAGTKLRGIDIDLNHMPDMAQTLACAALFAQGATTIRNVGNLRVKETDRLAALQTELTKLGANVVIDGDDISITPPAGGVLKPAAIDTYDDHRMAMSFAIVGLRSPGVVINDPACVNKTFPDYFEYLRKMGESK
jgi:3-phosphoshikimate 1-carboxyvinyltransferase